MEKAVGRSHPAGNCQRFPQAEGRILVALVQSRPRYILLIEIQYLDGFESYKEILENILPLRNS